METRAKQLCAIVATTGLLILLFLSRRGQAPVDQTDAYAPGAFRDVTQSAGLRFQYDNDVTPARRFIETTGGGVAFLDYNCDGNLDIFAVQGGRVAGSRPPSLSRCALYRNRGDGTFEDVTIEAGLGVDMGYGQGVSVADYDNDSWPDLLVTGYGGVHLWHNNHGHFEDVTAKAGLVQKGRAHWATSAVWLDYDRDGWLDLLVCHYASWFPEADRRCFDQNDRPMYCVPTLYPGDNCVLYHNNHDGTFTDVTEKAGLGHLDGRTLSAVSLDYDGDGWPDIFLTNDLAPNWLLHNRRDGTFEEIGAALGVAGGPDGLPLSGMGIAVGDFTGTGDESLFVGNFSHQPRSYYRNNGDGTFRWASMWGGVGDAGQPYLAFGVESLDYDLDGHLDLVIGNGHINDSVDGAGTGVTYREPQQLLHNDGQGRFTEDRAFAGDLGHPRITRGLAVGDYRNDGRSAVLVSGPGDPLTLFRNTGATDRHWIGFRLQGKHCNRDGVGAKLTLWTALQKQTRCVHSGSSYCSHSDVRPLFGLGKATEADRLEIAWPSGTHQTIPRLPADRYYLLTEAEGCVPDPRLNPNHR
jgi:hypothetical protein